MWTCPKCGREFQRTNQGHYCGKKPETVEEYICLQEEAVRLRLMELRRAICHGADGAREYIAWSMPFYRTEKDAVSFAACKNHVSFYVGAEAIEAFRERLGPYKTKKDAIYFPYSEELPVNLIGDITKWCLTMQEKG